MLSHFIEDFDISIHYQAGSLCRVIIYTSSLVLKSWCYCLGLDLDLRKILSVPVQIQSDIPNAMRLVVSL